MKFFSSVAFVLCIGCEQIIESKKVENIQKQDEKHQIWEYKCIETDRDNAYPSASLYLERKFNALGKDGWEMVGYGLNNGINARQVCFKRPQINATEAMDTKPM